MKYRFQFLDGEYWWGGTTVHGTSEPFTNESRINEDFRISAFNQTMPFYVSNKGRYIWSDKPFAIKMENGVFEFEGEEITLYEAGTCLRDAYLAAMKKHFPFTGKVPPHEFFKTAQYNTWMEYTYNPTQEGVLKYAYDIIDNGFKPGIFIIDEGWHGRYGIWEFDFAKFPEPKKMVDEIHKLGFTVMLWVVPYVCSDGQNFISHIRTDLNPDPECARKIFIRNEKGKVALMEWWNGYSAVLNLNNSYDVEYLDSQLQHLMKDYGIDGFKFDGGTIAAYSGIRVENGKFACRETAEELNIAWNRFGERYKFNEYKDTYKGGGRPVIQRLADRGHRWERDGINTIIPNSIVQGLIGHPFICPDMIGGGEWSFNVKPGFKIDEELFIRMAQCSALFPMMQFSWAPWRVLSEKALGIVREAAMLHSQFADEIIRLVEESAVSGEPVLRNLEYEDPHNGYETIRDEFMVGSNLLVAPIVTKGTFRKDVVFPKGKWQDALGNVYDGNKTYTVDSPLDRLLYFRRIAG